MPTPFSAAIHKLLPRPCYNRPFVCDGSPESCTTILIGENPATTMGTDWWDFWHDDTGFDLSSWREAYATARRKSGQRPTSSTRLRIDRLRAAGVACLETNAFMNEHLRGHGQGVANLDLLDLAIATLPMIRTVIAHGNEAKAFVASRQWLPGLHVVTTKHFRLLSYAAIDKLAHALRTGQPLPKGDPHQQATWVAKPPVTSSALRPGHLAAADASARTPDSIAATPVGKIMSDVEPVVTAPPTKYAGRYKLGVRPQNLASHNLMSWRIIEAILDAYGTADFWDLAVAVRGHKHGTRRVRGPQSFVRYCIRQGWLEPA